MRDSFWRDFNFLILWGIFFRLVYDFKCSWRRDESFFIFLGSFFSLEYLKRKSDFKFFNFLIFWGNVVILDWLRLKVVSFVSELSFMGILIKYLYCDRFSFCSLRRLLILDGKVVIFVYFERFIFWRFVSWLIVLGSCWMLR